jgi:hypothetical protein
VCVVDVFSCLQTAVWLFVCACCRRAIVICWVASPSHDGDRHQHVVIVMIMMLVAQLLPVLLLLPLLLVRLLVMKMQLVVCLPIHSHQRCAVSSLRAGLFNGSFDKDSAIRKGGNRNQLHDLDALLGDSKPGLLRIRARLPSDDRDGDGDGDSEDRNSMWVFVDIGGTVRDLKDKILQQQLTELPSTLFGEEVRSSDVRLQCCVGCPTGLLVRQLRW